MKKRGYVIFILFLLFLNIISAANVIHSDYTINSLEIKKVIVEGNNLKILVDNPNRITFNLLINAIGDEGRKGVFPDETISGFETKYFTIQLGEEIGTKLVTVNVIPFIWINKEDMYVYDFGEDFYLVNQEIIYEEPEFSQLPPAQAMPGGEIIPTRPLPPVQAPQPIFYASFDNGYDADIALGNNQAYYYGIDLVDGRSGKGVQILDKTSSEDGLLYETLNNIHKEEGTLMFWFKNNNWFGVDDKTYYFFDTGVGGFDIAKSYVSYPGKSYLFFRLEENINYQSTTLDKEPEKVMTWWPNEWHHLAVSWKLNPRETKLYIDGALIDEDYGNTISMGDLSYSMSIGRNRIGDINAEGIIDEFKIYGEVLTNEQILFEYASLATECEGGCTWNNLCYENINGADLNDGKIRARDTNSDVRLDKVCTLNDGEEWKDCDYSEDACNFCFSNWALSGFQNYGGPGYGSYENFGDEGCCGDDSDEYYYENPTNENDNACCNSINANVKEGICYQDKKWSKCGEFLCGLNLRGDTIFCGDGGNEYIKEFNSDKDSCTSEGSCDVDLNEGYFCCNGQYDCAYEGECYGFLDIVDLDSSDEVHDSLCNGQNWYDGDYDETTCTLVGGDWIGEGEFNGFGEYGNGYGGRLEIFNDTSTIYNVKDNTITECCGDDSGEYVKEDIEDLGSYYCCDNIDDTVVGGECVPENQNLRDDYYKEKCLVEKNINYCHKIALDEIRDEAYNIYAGTYDQVSVCNYIDDTYLKMYCPIRAGYLRDQEIPDTNAPEVELTLSNRCRAFVFQGTAIDHNGIESISYRVNGQGVDYDGSLKGSQFENGVFHKSIDLDAGGPYFLTLDVVDKRGQTNQIIRQFSCPDIFEYNVDGAYLDAVDDILHNQAAIDNNYIYIPQRWERTVKKFRLSDGALIDTINIEPVPQIPQDNGLQMKPVAVAVGNNEHIYVAFTINNPPNVLFKGGVYEYDSNGNFVRQIGKYPVFPNYIYWPKDIEFYNNNIIVLEYNYKALGGSDKVRYFNLDGSFDREIEFVHELNDIELDSNGMIYGAPTYEDGIYHQDGNRFVRIGRFFHYSKIEVDDHRIYALSRDGDKTKIFVYDYVGFKTQISSSNRVLEGGIDEILVKNSKMYKVYLTYQDGRNYQVLKSYDINI